MPYISNKRHRKILNRIFDNFRKLWIKPGYINYFLFKLAKERCFDYESYALFEGEVQLSLKEIYRRQIAPLEDDKIKENGDVE